MLTRFQSVNCSPFAKFFLLKFAVRYGDQSPWLNQVKDIISAVELPSSRFYTVVNELRLLGILDVQKSKPTEIPQVRYRIKTEEQTICPRSLCNLSHLHKDKIDQLLAWGTQPIRKRPHQLTIPQRILMIALLEEADAGGIVRNAGFSDLSQRTGLAIRQVKNQLAKLREFHYIRTSLPGGNSADLTGRFNSVHALNLKHPNFGQQRAFGETIIFSQLAALLPEDQINYFFFLRIKLLKIRSKSVGNSSDKINESKELINIANQARGLNASTPWVFLNWLCHDLASKALTELWSELPESESKLDLNKLTSLISTKIQQEWLLPYRTILELGDSKPPSQEKISYTKQPDLPLLPLLGNGLSVAVRDIAIGVKKVLMNHELLPDPAENLHLQILPCSHKGRYADFALDITTTNGNPLKEPNTFALMLEFNKKKLRAKSIHNVNELGDSAMKVIGLATPPLSHPSLSTIPKTQRVIHHQIE